MDTGKAVSTLALIASILGALVAPFTTIKPTYAILLGIGAAVVGVIGKGIAEATSSWLLTALGIVVAVTAAIVNYTDVQTVLSPHTLAVLVNIGAIAAALGKGIMNTTTTTGQLSSWIIAFAVTGFGFTQTGCSDKTKATLDRIGQISVILAEGYNNEIAALKAAATDPTKFTKAEAGGRALTEITKTLKEELAKIGEVNEKNVTEVTLAISRVTGVVNGLLQNPDVLNLPVNSRVAQILKWASVGLTQASLTLGLLFPNAGKTGIATIGEPKSKRTNEIIIPNIPDPPPVVKELLKAAESKK